MKEEAMSFLASGYCVHEDFTVRAHKELKATITGNTLVLMINGFKISVVRQQWFREEHHYLETRYLRYRIEVTYGYNVLVDDRVTEFRVSTDGIRVFLATRFTHLKDGLIGKGSNTAVKIHAFTPDRTLYVMPVSERCNCQAEKLGVHGCDQCLLRQPQGDAESLPA